MLNFTENFAMHHSIPRQILLWIVNEITGVNGRKIVFYQKLTENVIRWFQNDPCISWRFVCFWSYNFENVLFENILFETVQQRWAKSIIGRFLW